MYFLYSYSQFFFFNFFLISTLATHPRLAKRFWTFWFCKYRAKGRSCTSLIRSCYCLNRWSVKFTCHKIRSCIPLKGMKLLNLISIRLWVAISICGFLLISMTLVRRNETFILPFSHSEAIRTHILITNLFK